MKLTQLGYFDALDAYIREKSLTHLTIGRVVREHKDRYSLESEHGEYDGELIGNLRFAAESRFDLPAVGDWVAFLDYDENKALIHSILPRTSIIERQAVGKHGEKQIIAANVDWGIIIQAVDRDFSVNRIERYLTICNKSAVKPIIVLSKIDLINTQKLDALVEEVSNRIKNVPIIPLSNVNKIGLNILKNKLKEGKTFCLLGSSGVGKSTLINLLSGEYKMATGEIGSMSNRGKHVTSHRELIIIPEVGILIDNPGMREVGIADAEAGLDITFASIAVLAEQCRFSNCTHTHELGCAILAELEAGKIDKDALKNFHKMKKEQAFFDSTIAEKRRKDKQFGKMIKTVKKHRKSNKY